MAFGNISTFFTNGNTGFISAGVGGNRIAALRATVDTTESATTQTTHPANSSTRRVVSPYQTSANAGPDSTRGFAVATADMGSVVGALRFFPAGNHIANFYATGGNNLGNNTYFLRAYRVGPSPTFTKTQIGGEASATGSGLGAAIAVSLALPEIIFQAGETVMWEWDVQTNPGVVTGTVTISLGTSSGLTGSIVGRIETPELGVLAKTRGNADGVATVDGRAAILLPTRGDSAGVATVSGQLSALAAFVGSSAGEAITTGLGSAVAGAIGTSSGQATVSGQVTAVVGTVGTVNIGAGGGTITNVFPVFTSSD